METGGDQYLKTPEHLLPWHVKHMLDVYVAIVAVAGGLLLLGLTCTRILVRAAAATFGSHTADGKHAQRWSPASMDWSPAHLAAAAAAAVVAASAALAAANVIQTPSTA
jgi:hypothetical protein